jgi:hypothetical protein
LIISGAEKCVNTEQLLALVRELVGDEDRLEIQETVALLSQQIEQLVSSPAHPPYQQAVAENLASLTAELDELRESYTPGVWKRMEEIGATPYFSPALAARLRESMSANAMTPAVVHEEFKALATERDNFVEGLRQLADSLEKLGFGKDELEEGQSEVGFQIPRDFSTTSLKAFQRNSTNYPS